VLHTRGVRVAWWPCEAVVWQELARGLNGAMAQWASVMARFDMRAQRNMREGRAGGAGNSHGSYRTSAAD
jgi:hypothetical protein